jgi:hypothetical protein
VGAVRDLRRNRTTTSATLVLLSLSLALFGAVLLAGEQLKLVAAFIAGTGSNPGPSTIPRSSSSDAARSTLVGRHRRPGGRGRRSRSPDRQRSDGGRCSP